MYEALSQGVPGKCHLSVSSGGATIMSSDNKLLLYVQSAEPGTMESISIAKTHFLSSKFLVIREQNCSKVAVNARADVLGSKNTGIRTLVQNTGIRTLASWKKQYGIEGKHRRGSSSGKRARYSMRSDVRTGIYEVARGKGLQWSQR